MHILYVPLQSRQGGQTFVAGLTSELVHTTWRQKRGPISLSQPLSKLIYTRSATSKLGLWAGARSQPFARHV